MHPYVRKLQRSDEYYFKEGCYIIEVSNTDQDGAVSIAHVRVLPGQQTAWHWLTETYERYVILRGQGLVEVGGAAAAAVNAGDVVLIPPGTRQRISNTGEIDLELMAICSPRFSLENYHSG